MSDEKKKPSPEVLAKAQRAQTILMICLLVGTFLPLILFMIFGKK